MNKLFYIFLVLPIILFSCERIPEAIFNVNTVEPEVGQEVYFDNKSHNAVDFEWDFGDGVTSTAENPTHVFTGTGSFDVILKVYSKNGATDEATITINVIIPTLLEIEVLEYFSELPVPNISVWLFSNIGDWETHDSELAEAEGYADQDGIVVFSHLGPWVYYVDVWDETHDNYTLKEEQDGVALYIRTDEIIPNKINRFTAWVDVYETGKGDRNRNKTYAIVKFERMPDNKQRAVISPSEDDWQTLYNKSIKLK